jgi:seryl-tRNA synthetase
MLRIRFTQVIICLCFIMGMVEFSSAQVHSDTLLKEILFKVNEVSESQNQLRKNLEEGRKLNAGQDAEITRLKSQVQELSKEKASLLEKNESLSKSKQLNEAKLLKGQKDSLANVITILNDTLKRRSDQLLGVRAALPKYQQKGEEMGFSTALKKVSQDYNLKSLDTLIACTNLYTVRRDLEILSGDKTNSNVKLQELQHYFLACAALERKYSDNSVQTAITHLENIKSSSEQVKKLRENLEVYQDYNNALLQTFQEISKLDSQVSAAKDRNSREYKINKINLEMVKYMYDYSSFTNFSYLQKCVNEVIHLKNDNPDADLNGMIKKLK